ncbi:MAG: glycoside hydrolase family 73 protein [Actinobacteria bacterium]|nr:glycoside hydrolase family 73 protein [Actinomycetota bacterium]
MIGVTSVSRPTWQQATALVSLSTCGAMTGLAFAHGSVDEMTSPTRMPVHLVALNKPATPASANDSALRSAIVKVANYYLQMAQSKSPAQMEAMIWSVDSVDGVDHGESCAAFASLTLELGAQATGQQSWVSGGTSYPWALHSWADVRVDPNPDSMNIISVLQDAQAHQRWHPLGDGYPPLPGDWVLFDGHVEVVTSYSAGVLYTIGGDSGPNLSVNAHQYSAPLAGQGIVGFVNNGELPGSVSQPGAGAAAQAGSAGDHAQGQPGQAAGAGQAQASSGQAAIPGIEVVALVTANGPATGGGQADSNGGAATKGTAGTVGTAGKAGAAAGTARTSPGRRSGSGGRRAASGGNGMTGTISMPGIMAGAATAGAPGTGAKTAVIPGLQAAGDQVTSGSPAPAPPSYTRNNVPAASTHVPGTASQQAFISQVAPGAIAAHARYGVPASVTIAQAIDESGWGQSALAVRDHNLFGIKGSGPAGSDMLPTQEFLGGTWVTQTAPFRVYHNVAESIADHGELLATSPYYQQAMADRHVPDAFANDLTGVYATDPNYGASLIGIMRLYNLYQYDAPSATAPQVPVPASAAASGGTPSTATIPSSGGLLGSGGLLSSGGVVNEGGAVTPGAAVAAGGTASPAPTGHSGGTAIPGYLDAYVTGPLQTSPAAAPRDPAAAPGRAAMAGRRPAPRVTPRGARPETNSSRYVAQLPRTVTTAFLATAKTPLSRAQPLYADVASRSGIRWELLAACDWMQCKAQPRYSPVHGEKLGTVNASGTVFRTKSQALAQCASDLVELAMAVYWIDITARRRLSVRDLAKVFAAFRWGGLLRLHNISAMEFPYSVEGLTVQHIKMRWPDINDPNAPDKPGTRFRMPFGAVPVVLSLGYPAVA